MEPNNANDFNAGNPADGSQANPGSGTPGANPAADQGTPGNQPGQQTDARDAEIAKYKEEARRLNAALVEARRTGNRNPQNPQAQPGQPDFNDPTVQLGMAMKMATGELRSNLEGVLSLYPELPAETVASIRKNPWAWASEGSYLGLNVNDALLDIETQIAEAVEKLTPATPAAPAPTPASVNPNSPAAPQGDSQPDPMEDWNLPMDQLEAKAKKAEAQLTKTR